MVGGSEAIQVTEVNPIQFIKEKEGLITVAKQLAGEKYMTIGFGHYGADVKEDQTITEERAEWLLRLLGIVMEDKLEQLANTALPISSTLFPMITVCKFAQ